MNSPPDEHKYSHTRGLQQAAYSYRVLDYTHHVIRLVRLDRTPGHIGPIRCSLEQYEIAKAPKYTAVSYTWGTADGPQEILLDG